MNEARNARIVRIKKEARALFWPWCAAMIGGALPIFFPHSSYAAKLNFLSFFFGVPVLATLSLGNEFYHRTFSLWLTQPVSRMQLWADKMIVMCAAVLSAATVSGIGMFFFALPKMKLTYNAAAAVAYVIITLASATFWTLAARSAVGGLLIIGFVWWAIYMFIGNIETGKLEALPLATARATAISVFAICFAVVMLWLGARKLARFQVTGGTSGEDLLVAGPSVMPEALAEWFRCRPSGALLNLIRKEFRLLRPLWVIELMTVVYLTCLAILRLLPSPPVFLPETVRQWAVLGPPAMTSMGLVGLAGILSLGEERRSGTYAWHMTLPIYARTQWLVKLLVAMFAGLACAMLFPFLALMVVGSFYGSTFMFLYLHAATDMFIAYLILTFSCFWCACAANGTVNAATWAMPSIAAIPFACAGGIWLGQDLTRSTGTLKDFVISSFHLSPLALVGVTDYARSKMLWLFVPTLLFALLQSYRLFRTPPQNSRLWTLRCMLPLIAVTILWSFSAYAGFVASTWQPFEETRRALETLPGGANFQVAGDDLARSPVLSSPTRRWLKGARIAVAPDNLSTSVYRVTIHLAGGLECRLAVIQKGGMAASCGQ
ncbi:MAG TPA: hypothetical protein VEI73_02805 [Candidatus Acidoferrum sp.]|nr:hypothetical protein [Candidatus Acidoferrum sp.]